MPDTELLRIQEVVLHPGPDALISRPGARVHCDYCGEDIINEREVIRNGATLCRTCAGDGYYLIAPALVELLEAMPHPAK